MGKEVKLVSKVHEKEEGRNLGGDVEEIDEYIVEEEVFKVEDEVIKVESGDSGSEEESDDSESSEDWATQYSNSIRRFHSLSPEGRQTKSTERQSRWSRWKAESS